MPMLLTDTIIQNLRPILVRLVVTLLPLVSLYSHAENLPLFSAAYNASIKGFAVTATRELRLLDNTASQHENAPQQGYSLIFKATSWAATLEEQSDFTLSDGALLSKDYRFSQTAFGKNKQRSVSIDYDTNQINSRQKEQDTILSMPNTPVFDLLNYQLQLQLDVSQGKDTLEYTIANKGRLSTYRFEVENEATLDTDLGLLNTVKVKVIRENSDKTTYIWFAKDWGYLLAQLKQYENDKETLSIRLRNGTVNHIDVKGL